jgi:hypothetical protein
MANKQKLEQKLGEVLGLEMAAQKAVEELSSNPLQDSISFVRIFSSGIRFIC